MRVILYIEIDSITEFLLVEEDNLILQVLSVLLVC